MALHAQRQKCYGKIPLTPLFLLGADPAVLREVEHDPVGVVVLHFVEAAAVARLAHPVPGPGGLDLSAGRGHGFDDEAEVVHADAAAPPPHPVPAPAALAWPAAGGHVFDDEAEVVHADEGAPAVACHFLGRAFV